MQVLLLLLLLLSRQLIKFGTRMLNEANNHQGVMDEKQTKLLNTFDMLIEYCISSASDYFTF